MYKFIDLKFNLIHSVISFSVGGSSSESMILFKVNK